MPCSIGGWRRSLEVPPPQACRLPRHGWVPDTPGRQCVGWTTDATATDWAGAEGSDGRRGQGTSTEGGARRRNSAMQIGLEFYIGQRPPQDYEQGVMWFRKAAEQGHADAQFLLGGVYTPRARRRSGLCTDDGVVAQGGRAGICGRAVQPRHDVLNWERGPTGLCGSPNVEEPRGRSGDRRRTEILRGWTGHPCQGHDAHSDCRSPEAGERVAGGV